MAILTTIFETLLGLAFYLIGIIAALHALLRAREPRSALIWVAICLFVPVLGALFYSVFGVNRVKQVTQNWHSYGLSHVTSHDGSNIEDKLYSENVPSEYKISIASGDRLTQNHIRFGCDVIPLFDNEQTYPAMIEAIHNAKESVFLMTYIFSSKGLGGDIVKALADAVKRKVEVKVLIDGIGNCYSRPSTYRLLKQHHVPVRLFLSPFRSLRGFMFLNMRNHAKIMVVDGKVGFTGGMNIRDEGPMHDLHFKCVGPIVGTLQDVFLNLWYFAKREYERPRVIFYDDSLRGQALARGIDNGPYQEFPHIPMRLGQMLNEAKRHIRIMTPYFVVGNALVTVFISARLRGVEVEVILPEKNNLSFVKGATEALLPMLIKQGIKFYYRQGEFAHSKVAIIDDYYVMLGSANLDTRSFLLNFEFNLEVYDKYLAETMIQHFEITKKNSRRITNAWLQNRNFLVKFLNAICKLFAPYL